LKPSAQELQFGQIADSCDGAIRCERQIELDRTTGGRQALDFLA
jgi:hypothetical protein